jgi:hypothetical protein
MESSPQPSSPFDFDEDDVEGTIREKGVPKNRLLRWCCIFAIGSFIVSFVGSVVENNAVGNPSLESTAIAINRAGMVGMLVGCIGVFLAFRLPMMSTPRSHGPRQSLGWSPWWTLFVCNITLCPLAIVMIFLFAIVTRGSGMVLIAFFIPLLLSLMLVISIFQQGVFRAYAIGFLVSMIHGLIFLVPLAWMASSELFNGYYSPYSYGGRSYFGSSSQQGMLAATTLGLLLSAASGMLCSGYVAFLQHTRKSPRDQALPITQESTEDLKLSKT